MTQPSVEEGAPGLAARLAEHVRDFRACYGPGEAPRVFFSPGRVNLFGGHLDYNGGPVMPTAIDRGTFLAVRRRTDRRCFLASTLDPNGLELDLDAAPTTRLGRWVDYPLGVLIDVLVRARAAGRDEELCGLEILCGGNLPVGAGLSSSASICVGTATLLDSLWGLSLDVMDRVRTALRAERGFVGVHCGIMDPFAVGLARPGHVLWLDCKDESWEHLPLDFSRLSIAVANSGVARELAAGEFNRRVKQCGDAFDLLAPFVPGATCLRDVPLEVFEEHEADLPPEAASRARHVLHEVRRTFQAREAVLAGDLARMGAGLTRTHQSLREHYACSSPELDLLVESALAGGALGARLTGAGFGGCTVMMIERGREDEVRAVVQDRFHAAFGRVPEVEVFAGDEGPREVVL